MANFRSIQLILASAVVAVIFGLLGSSSVHAKGESYKWDGDKIVISGGMMETKATEFPSSFSKVADNKYRNYSGDKPAQDKCGAELTLSSDKKSISNISLVTCVKNGTQAGYDTNKLAAQVYNPGSGSNKVGPLGRDYPIAISGTPPSADPKVPTNTDNAARAKATYEAFGGVLDVYKDSFCKKQVSARGGDNNNYDKDVAACKGSTEFDVAVHSCWTQARSSAAATGRYDANADVAALTKKSFSTCLAGKTGKSSDEILRKIKDTDVAKINAAAAEASKALEDAADEKTCTEAGGVWENGACASEEEEETSSCSIDGIGWLICPVMNFLGTMLDTAFNFLSDNFLKTNVGVLNNDTVKNAWGVMRLLSNIVIIIVFLIVIFSQFLGAPGSNYQLKSMAKRIVIGAILINLSFIICQLAVDLSNILGYGFKDMFDAMGGAILPDPKMNGDSTAGLVDQALSAAGIVAALLAGAAGVITLALALSFPVVGIALLALCMIALILLARTALIIVLTILAPLAFAAYILPNTKDLFSKWSKIYWSLLLLFPIISIVFGASSLVGKILLEVGAKADDGSMMLQLTALGAVALPLFVVPALLKGALSATGTMGTKLQGMSGALNSKIGKTSSDTSRLGRIADYRSQQIGRNRAMVNSGIDPNPDGKGPAAWTRRRIAGMNKRINNSRFSGGFGDYESGQASRLEAKEDQAAMTAANLAINNGWDSGTVNMDDLQVLATGGTAAGIAASTQAQKLAQAKVLQMGKNADVANMFTAISESGTAADKRMLAGSIAGAGTGAPIWAQKAKPSLGKGESIGADQAMVNAIDSGAYSSAAGLAGAKDDELQSVLTTIKGNSSLNSDKVNATRQAAQMALTAPEYAGKIGETKTTLENLAAGAPSVSKAPVDVRIIT